MAKPMGGQRDQWSSLEFKPFEAHWSLPAKRSMPSRSWIYEISFEPTVGPGYIPYPWPE